MSVVVLFVPAVVRADRRARRWGRRGPCRQDSLTKRLQKLSEAVQALGPRSRRRHAAFSARSLGAWEMIACRRL